MKIVLDTNVFISGIFFRGPPSQILQAWKSKKLRIILSQDILDEYQKQADQFYYDARSEITEQDA
jgi:putative PIN family toxin of toxin-antitoxin system